MSELCVSQAFRKYQALQITTLYEPVMNFCSKKVISSFILYCLGAPICSCMAKTAQGLKASVSKKKFVFPIVSWIFTIFQILFLLMVPHDVIIKEIFTNSIVLEYSMTIP
jgi:hypothetical protein